MGVFDLPAPVFSAIDGVLEGLPGFARLFFWALVTAILSMYLYWLCSAQDKVGAAKQRAISARKAMAGYEGHEFSEMLPLARESLGASLKHFGIVLGPALLSSLPALTLIVWVSNQFSYAPPKAGTSISIQTVPENSLPTELVWPAIDAPVDIQDKDGNTLFTLPLSGQVPVVHKRQWWNSLIGNPNGYIVDTASISDVYFDLPSIRYMGFGPGWMRGWEFTYFLVLILCSLGIKVAFRIH